MEDVWSTKGGESMCVNIINDDMHASKGGDLIKTCWVTTVQALTIKTYVNEHSLQSKSQDPTCVCDYTP